MSKQKKLLRQQELLKNFEGDFYQEKKINDKWYVKMWNGGTKRWQVAIYSEDSFKRYKSYWIKKCKSYKGHRNYRAFNTHKMLNEEFRAITSS